MPRACPDCGNVDIAPIGRGTERLEEQLARAAAAARASAASTPTPRAAAARLRARLAAVHAGEVDVLVGTQMVAKGHDFRRVTLVAAVNPDSALFSSDFRAPERLFALLMQAAGRAGRDSARRRAARCGCRPGIRGTRCTRRCARTTTRPSPRRSWPSAAPPALPPFAHLALLRAEARTADAARAFLHAAAAGRGGAAGMRPR